MTQFQQSDDPTLGLLGADRPGGFPDFGFVDAEPEARGDEQSDPYAVMIANLRRFLDHVAAAKPLDQKQLKALTDAVTAYSGKKVRLDTRVDPSLIGGLVVTVGSRQVDASLKRKLQQLDVAMRGLG